MQFTWNEFLTDLFKLSRLYIVFYCYHLYLSFSSRAFIFRYHIFSCIHFNSSDHSLRFSLSRSSFFSFEKSHFSVTSAKPRSIEAIKTVFPKGQKKSFVVIVLPQKRNRQEKENWKEREKEKILKRSRIGLGKRKGLGKHETRFVIFTDNPFVKLPPEFDLKLSVISFVFFYSMNRPFATIAGRSTSWIIWRYIVNISDNRSDNVMNDLFAGLFSDSICKFASNCKICIGYFKCESFSSFYRI